MSYIKASLKNAREAIEAKKWENAIKNCENVLQYEADNYMAYVYREKNLNEFIISLITELFRYNLHLL